MPRPRFSHDDITFDEIEQNITSPTVRRLLENIQINYKAQAQAAWRKSTAQEVFSSAQLAEISRWDNSAKVEALIGCVTTAAECKKIATHIDQALTLFTYTDCLARYLMEIGVELEEIGATQLIEAYGRRMKGHRQFPFFGTRHSTAQEIERGRSAFVMTIKPIVVGAVGPAHYALQKAVGEALPMPDADYAAFAGLFDAEQLHIWEDHIAEAAKRKADAEDVDKIDRMALLTIAKQAIADFATDHQNETFYAFSFDATMLCLDSVEQRAELIKDLTLRSHYLREPEATPVWVEEINPGDFTYQGFFDLRDVSPALYSTYADYYEQKLRVANGRFYAGFAEWLTNMLVSEKAFDCLRKTRRFRVSWSKDND